MSRIRPSAILFEFFHSDRTRTIIVPQTGEKRQKTIFVLELPKKNNNMNSTVVRGTENGV